MRKLDSNLTSLNFTDLNITFPTDKKNRTEMNEFRGTLKNILSDCRVEYKTELSFCKSNFKEAKLQCEAFKCDDEEIFVDGECVVVD